MSTGTARRAGRLRSTLVHTFRGLAGPRWVARAASVALTVRGRQPCAVSYDDGMWLHRYRDGVLVDTRPGGLTPSEQDARARDVFLYDYEPGDGDTVVDIGAGVGGEVRLLSRLVGPRGRVVCVEAHPVTARCLRRTVAENALDNVTVVETAVSRTSGTVSFTTDAGSHIANRLGHGEAGGLRVPSRTLGELLDGLGDGPVDLVAINIEGAEGEVLVPPPPQLARVRHLAVSCHDFVADQPGREWQRTSAAVSASLVEAGFVLRRREGDARPWIGFYRYAARG